MFSHVKETIQPVKVDTPDPRFGQFLLEQFGGATARLPPALHKGATHSSNTRQRLRRGRLGFAVIGLAREKLFRFLAFYPAGHLTYDDEEACDNRDGDEREWGQLFG